MTAIDDGESIRLTEAGTVYTLEKGGSISIETNGNDITIYRNGKRLITVAYTAFTTPTFTSAEDGREQIEAMLSAPSGTGGSDKAEDSVHTSGDRGKFMLAVRVDPNAAGNPAAALAAAGDYIPIIVDNLGRLYVAPHALLTSEVHVGAMGGNTSVIDATFSGDGTAYAAGDVIGATQTLTGAMRVNGGTGVLQSIRLLDQDDINAAFDVVLMQNTQSLGTDNAVVSITDANAIDILGIVSITTGDNVDLINSRMGTVRNLGLGVQSAASSSNLFAGLITRTAGTFTSNALRLRFTFLQD